MAHYYVIPRVNIIAHVFPYMQHEPYPYCGQYLWLQAHLEPRLTCRETTKMQAIPLEARRLHGLVRWGK